MNEGHSEKTLLSDGKGRKEKAKKAEKAEKAKTQRVNRTHCKKRSLGAGQRTGGNHAATGIDSSIPLHGFPRPFPEIGAIINRDGSCVNHITPKNIVKTYLRFRHSFH